MKKSYDVGIRWTAFPLRPQTPEGGITLEEVYAGRGMDLQSSKLRLKRVADELGLPLGDRKMTYNSRLAQELAKWAETKGKGDLFHHGVFRAYYVDGKNIGKKDELIALVQSIDLPEEEGRSVLEQRTFKEAVDADWSRCHTLGITAVPTFLMNGHEVVGAQPYEVLERLLKSCGAMKRKN